MSVFDHWKLIRYNLSVQEQLETLALFDDITDVDIGMLTHHAKSSRVGILLEYLGPVRLQNFLPQFLGFLQDYNWPGARGTDRMLGAAGEMLVPEIRRVFREENDSTWNYWIILVVLGRWAPRLVALLKPDLLYLIQYPDRENAAIEAFSVLKMKGLLDENECNSLYQQLRTAFQRMQPWSGHKSARWEQEQASLLADLEEVMQEEL
jgi:hypothetical protein